MPHPVIVLTELATSESLLSQVITSQLGLSRVDILLQSQIEDSASLNTVLSKLYYEARTIATKAGHDYTFEINVLFNKAIGRSVTTDWNILYSSAGSRLSFEVPRHIKTIQLDTSKHSRQQRQDAESSRAHKYKHYRTVAVGGTFDHIHDGHKVLLSLASFLAGSKLIVGVTGPQLLTKKKYAEALESFERRSQSVLDFLGVISNPKDYTVEIYKINDVCGPTGFVREIDALVVSAESSKGGAFVNNYREERGFNKLDVVSILVIGEDDSNEQNGWAGKLSSTDIRGKILARGG